jgi:hypothetical protein
VDARIEANELLYAMKNGAKFRNGKTATQVREEWANGKITADNIADMAAKAENSKPSSGARETMSWDEIRMIECSIVFLRLLQELGLVLL